MTAVAADYDELLSPDGRLTEARASALSEDELHELLLRRFRAFLGRGHGHAKALLLAAGHTAVEADFVLSAARPPRILQ